MRLILSSVYELFMLAISIILFFSQNQRQVQIERQMEQIFEDRAANKSFLDREWTLYVKACHLAYNCSCNVSVIIKTPQNQLRSFCSMYIQNLLNTFITTRDTIKVIAQEQIEKVCYTPPASFIQWLTFLPYT